mgnify:CR=1 FL=1
MTALRNYLASLRASMETTEAPRSDTLRERMQAEQLLEQAESAVRASRQFRPDYGIDGPHVPRRLSMLQRRRVRNAIDILACLAVILIVLVLAFHQINLANLFR